MNSNKDRFLVFDQLILVGEKVLKIDVRYFFSGFSWLGGSYLLTTAMSLVLASVFSRFLSREVFGEYSLYKSFFELAAVFGLVGMPVTVVKGVSNGKIRVFFDSVIFTGVFSLLGSLSLVGYGFYLENTENKELLFLLAALFPFFHLTGLISAYFEGKKMFGWSGSLSIATSLFSSVGLILALVFGRQDLMLLLVLSFLPKIFVFGFGFFKTPLVSYLKKFDGRIVNKETMFGFKLSLIDVLPRLARQMDKIIIGVFLSPQELALYVFALAPSEMLKGAINNSVLLFLPKLAGEKVDNFGKNMFRHFRTYLLLTSVVVLAFTLLLPILFRVAFPSYLDAVEISILISFSLITAPVALFSSFFRAKGDVKAITWINTGHAFSHVALLAFMVGVLNLGVLGAAVARVLSRFAFLLISAGAFWIKRNKNLGYR